MPIDNPTQVIYEERRPLVVQRPTMLCVVRGHDLGAACPLEQRRVRVGTSADNDLVLNDPRVSPHHLEVRVVDRGFLVVDLRSAAGTMLSVSDQACEARVREALVRSGAELLLGATTLRIEAQAATQRSAPARERFGELIGAAGTMQQLYGLLELLAPSDLTVLLEGETGSGKERIGCELHRRSPRSERPFCVADCGALPAALSEPELLGHERGAFAGATGERKGLLERADGGTLFLDEVSELAPELQARLLRVMETRSFRRVGGDHPRKVDVRIIAATSRDLTEAVGSGRFREELCSRLAAVRLVVPPLRERREDIVALARHFLWEAGCLDPELLLTPELTTSLTQRMWPGNAGELRSLMQRAVLLSDGALDGEVSQADVVAPPADPAAWLAGALPPNLLRAPYKRAKEEVLAAFDALYTRSLVERHGTNISGMAREAGVDRQLVRKLLKEHS